MLEPSSAGQSAVESIRTAGAEDDRGSGLGVGGWPLALKRIQTKVMRIIFHD